MKIVWCDRENEYYGVQVLEPVQMQHVLQKGASLLFASAQWEHIQLYVETTEQADTLLVLAVCNYLASRGGLLFHSALVEQARQGILFLGPSGVGKTTQAELWQQFLGANILNGDLTFVRQREDGFYGYGAPWHGSSPYCINASVRIKALVLLSQAEENQLTVYTGVPCVQSLLQQLHLPIWDEAGTACCLETLDRLLEAVPAYHLACRPDEASVLLLKQELHL